MHVQLNHRRSVKLTASVVDRRCKSGLRSVSDEFSPADCDHSRRAVGDI